MKVGITHFTGDRVVAFRLRTFNVLSEDPSSPVEFREKLCESVHASFIRHCGWN